MTDSALLSPPETLLGTVAPTLVQMGSEEICYDDGLRMAERIHEAGGRVRFEEWQGMFHTWHHYAGALSGADEAIEAVGAWVRDRTGVASRYDMRANLSIGERQG